MGKKIFPIFTLKCFCLSKPMTLYIFYSRLQRNILTKLGRYAVFFLKQTPNKHEWHIHSFWIQLPFTCWTLSTFDQYRCLVLPVYYVTPLTRVVPVNCGLCYKTRLSVRNSMKFVCYVNIHLRHIFYKYGWNHSLDNKVMKLCLRVSLRMRRTSQIILLYFQRGVVKCFDSTLFK